MRIRSWHAALAVTLLTIAASSACAQSFGSAEIDRAFRPGAYVPYDGAPFSHRYNYYDAPFYFPGVSLHQFWYLYELDREERAERFGTRYGPHNPPLFNRLLDRRCR